MTEPQRTALRTRTGPFCIRGSVMHVRKVMAIGAAAILLLAVTYMYPVGGSIWRAGQVTGIAIVHDGHERTLNDASLLPRLAADTIQTARVDRFRRLTSGMPNARCVPQRLVLHTNNRTVPVHLHCTSGFIFDYVPRDAWDGP